MLRKTKEVVITFLSKGAMGLPSFQIFLTPGILSKPPSLQNPPGGIPLDPINLPSTEKLRYSSVQSRPNTWKSSEKSRPVSAMLLQTSPLEYS